jgi:hypothetical protein
VADHALLGVANASGSVELLRLVVSEVSDWGKALWWGGYLSEALLMKTFSQNGLFNGGLCHKCSK